MRWTIRSSLLSSISLVVGPWGSTTVATAVGEQAGTIEEVYEPYLIQEGFLHRTPRGRMATEQAYKHLGYVNTRKVRKARCFDMTSAQTFLGNTQGLPVVKKSWPIPFGLY